MITHSVEERSCSISSGFVDVVRGHASTKKDSLQVIKLPAGLGHFWCRQKLGKRFIEVHLSSEEACGVAM